MSELRIALVAEGPTDHIIIEAALKAIVDCPFILTPLQPEPTYLDGGGGTSGWCGVVKWCHAIGQNHHGPLDSHPLLSPMPFDLIILQIDADVADKTYDDCSLSVSAGWKSLPCPMPCPPSVGTCDELRQVVTSWLGPVTPGPKTIICIPSKATDTWLLVAILGNPEADIECVPKPDEKLGQLPKAQRIKKTKRNYFANADTITKRWCTITSHCSQALTFQLNVQQIVGRHCPPIS
ncbi:MAG: hypothetical protein J0I17_12520 ['Candidatus Kapabacteria' thiocyanatum]|nr:hypothetical protein ['Candidatus Kapabacteria' thiocyanatum]